MARQRKQRIKIQDLSVNQKVSQEELRHVTGGGDDSQMATLSLQDSLNSQQQTLQMLSNITKLLHDTTTSVVRKKG